MGTQQLLHGSHLTLPLPATGLARNDLHFPAEIQGRFKFRPMPKADEIQDKAHSVLVEEELLDNA